jgi:CHAT domain-containing protein
VNSRELTQAEHEASEVASRLHTQPLLGNRATAAEVGPRLTSARILHFATHGILDGENPYRSRLSLANGDSLEGWWLFQQPLEADLVVLSACNSAQRQMLAGDVLGNGSERLSLTAALNARGVGAVVASWWRVNDAGAEALMEKFYEELTRETNEDPVLALYQAKLAVGSDPWQLNSNAAFQVFISSLVRLPGNPRSTTNPAL